MKKFIILLPLFFCCVKFGYTHPGGVLIAMVVASADDGNVASNTIDGNYNTRWSANGNNQWIRFYLDTTAIIKAVNIAWYKGNERKALFDIQASLDSTNWKTVFSGSSGGGTTTLEVYNITPGSARYIRILGHGNNVNTWNSITEVEILKDSSLLQTLDPNPSLNTAMGHLGRAQAFTDKASYPRSTNPDGTIKRVAPGDWTSGFFPGSLWLMYENTKDTIWKKRAEQWTSAIEGQKNNTSTHDVGFMLYSSFGEGYRLTRNPKYKGILLQGAKSLSTRFNSTVGCIRSWNNPNYTFPVIIDNMMNLEILFWATKVSGDSSFYKIAVKHALTTMANHFRPDNSSYHVVDYNPNDGSVISKVTAQGLNNLSDWARGQAWGLYGFTMCYRETGDIRFLNMAKKIADFYIAHPNMPADLVPFWDFDAFDYRDASAACIAGSALLELSQFAPEKRTTYYNFGINILKSLASTNFTASVGTNNDFILKHSVGNKPANNEVNTPLSYADYYFIQALLRHKKPAPLLTATGGDKQVVLKWNASTGATFYNIKRSTVSGGPYTTVASNITDTNYINSGLSSGKTYFYKVTSWNAIGAGGTSGEVKATTYAAPLEAEQALLNGAVIASNQPGFTGSGFADYKSISGDFIEWTVNTSAQGSYSLHFRYANGGATDRPLKLEINGIEVLASLSFSPTQGWGIWSVSSATANLISGTNKVKLTAIGFSGPNVDHLALSFNNSLQTNSIQSIQRALSAEVLLPTVSDVLSVDVTPNPVTNTLNISAEGLQTNKRSTISVLSVSGIVVKTNQSNTLNKIVQLDVSSLSAGVYFIKLINGGKVLYKQFVKL